MAQTKSSPKLEALVFCQPLACRFSGESLTTGLTLPDRLAPGRPVGFDELSDRFVSQYLRPSDVPLAFHRENPGAMQAMGMAPSAFGLRPNQEMTARLEAYGRMLQYVFDDGTCLFGNQVLFHPHSKFVARHLLPLNVNVKSDLQEPVSYTLETGQRSNQASPQRYAWMLQAEQVIMSVLLSAIRAVRQNRMGEDDDRGPKEIYFTLIEKPEDGREALRLDSIELAGTSWGPWRLTTDLHPSESGVFPGRARLELDPNEIGDLAGLSRSFLVSAAERKIVFHTFADQVTRLKLHAPRTTPTEGTPTEGTPTESTATALQASALQATVLQPTADAPNAEPTAPPSAPSTPAPEASEAHPTSALETGIAIHLSGHAAIQATLHEAREIMDAAGRQLPVHPRSLSISRDRVRPKLAVTGDGTFRFQVLVDAADGPWELHGFPQSSAYILFNLQAGLGATTGYSNTAIAHARKGLKRERDMKILRNLGHSMLIFFDAANFALGLPLSDGTVARSQVEVCESLFTRLGSLILKSEGWPVQQGSLTELCSKNVTTLIEGFVSQIVGDIGEPNEGGREISIYLPQGELKIEGLARAVAIFFHALVADLVQDTGGACFTRARTKFFENFFNGRPTFDREDIVARRAVDPDTSARMIYRPGINERYALTTSSVPPRGFHLLALSGRGFDLAIDGKQIEEFDAHEFRPEFTLREEGLDFVSIGAGKIDWFELHPKFFFKGTEITMDQASRLSKDGMLEFQGKLYRVKPQDLPSIKRLSQFWAKMQAGGSGAKTGNRRKTEDTYYQLPRSQTLELLALRAKGVKVRGGPKWDEITRFYDSLDQARQLEALPDSFKALLQPYQSLGVQWLLDLFKLGLGGILADEMGLGKTVTTLAFLESLRAKDAMGPVLVVVPTSLTYNWISEAERFAPDMGVAIFNSRDPETSLDFLKSRREQAVVVCTYGLLQEHSELLQQVNWNVIVFDEAQSLKNITTKRTTAARKLRGNFKLCLTGTPLENHYGELYSLFDLMVPGSLGELPDFRERYVNPSKVLREDLEFLKLKAKPLLLRRTKSQVMHQLPPKVETTIKLPFEDEQKKIYRDIATSYNEQVRSQITRLGEAKTQLQMLTALLRLRQVCSDPAGIPGVKYSGEPPKLTTLIEALESVIESGASALIFTQFLTTFERIRAALSLKQIPHFDISGSDSRLAREKKLKSFRDEEGGAVMLMTLKTGGVGLNLTKASYVFHIEPWWNPAVENQATDRAHRIGQESTVQVYRYIIKESVEEKIELLKDVKSRRFDALFSVTEEETEMNPGSSRLSQSDFEFLLGI